MLKNTNLTRRQALAAFGSITAGLALAACGASQTQSTDTASTSDASSSSDASAATEDVTVRVASLKGPTAIGLVSMMDTTSGVPTEDTPTEPAEGSTGITYSYTARPTRSFPRSSRARRTSPSCPRTSPRSSTTRPRAACA